MHQVGDLVYIPQSVKLMGYDLDGDQYVMPARVLETKKPILGIVTFILKNDYIQVYCNGDRWSVKNNNIYKI